MARWAVLWIARYFLFFLSDTHESRRHLRLMSWRVGRIVWLHARALAPLPRAQSAPRPRSAPCGFVRRRVTSPARRVRAALGAAMRAQMRGASALDSICALLRMLWRIHAIAARIAKRLARGLTRLAPLIARRPPAESGVSQHAPMPAGADSS